MTNLKALLSRLAKDDSGQDLIEYALVAALIALGAIGAMKTVSGDISTLFSTVGSQLTSAGA
jgi:pilus assembly protein Flp/PilA